MQLRELRYQRRKGSKKRAVARGPPRYQRHKGSKKLAVARDRYLQDTKVFIREITSHRDRCEERKKKILIDFTTSCNDNNANTEVLHTLLFKLSLMNVNDKEKQKKS